MNVGFGPCLGQDAIHISPALASAGMISRPDAEGRAAGLKNNSALPNRYIANGSDWWMPKRLPSVSSQ